MTGPEHYEQAERLLVSCQLVPPSDVEQYPALEDGVDSIAHALAAAQVHATLAAAAATIEAAYMAAENMSAGHDWRKALGEIR